jgi:hypothetical protein
MWYRQQKVYCIFLLPPFQIVGHFDKLRFIVVIMYNKVIYNLERRKYALIKRINSMLFNPFSSVESS